MKAMILAAATLSIAAIAAAEPAPNSDVEARLAALEKINVTAYKPQQAATDESKDPQVDAILQKAVQAEEDGSPQPQRLRQ